MLGAVVRMYVHPVSAVCGAAVYRLAIFVKYRHRGTRRYETERAAWEGGREERRAWRHTQLFATTTITRCSLPVRNHGGSLKWRKRKKKKTELYRTKRHVWVGHMVGSLPFYCRPGTNTFPASSVGAEIGFKTTHDLPRPIKRFPCRYTLAQRNPRRREQRDSPTQQKKKSSAKRCTTTWTHGCPTLRGRPQAHADSS